MERRFHYVATTAVTRPPRLDDLPGEGRWDLVSRVVLAAIGTSHGIRPNTSVTLYLGGPPQPGVALRIGPTVRSLHPGERAVAALLGKALERPAFPVFQEILPGIEIARHDPATAIPAHSLVLDTQGRDLHADPPTAPLDVVVGDHAGLPRPLREALHKGGAAFGSIGPVAIHADHAVAVLHNLLDRRQR